MMKSIKVRIAGRDYPLRVQADDEQAMRGLAMMVDERIESFRQTHPGHPDVVAAVVAALGLAEELSAARDTSSVLLSALDQEVAILDRELASALESERNT